MYKDRVLRLSVKVLGIQYYVVNSLFSPKKYTRNESYQKIIKWTPSSLSELTPYEI